MLFYYLRVAILHSFPTHFVGVKTTDHHKQSRKLLLKYQTLQNFPSISSYKMLYKQEGRTQPQDYTCVEGLPHGYTWGQVPFHRIWLPPNASLPIKSLPLTVHCLWPGFLTRFYSALLYLTLLSSNKYISSDILWHT